MIRIDVQVVDEATPLLKKLVEENPKITKSALKSTGFWTMKQIQAGIRSGSPGGQAYAPFMPYNLKRKLNSVMGKPSSRIPLGKMSRAVKYKAQNGGNEVVIGWLSASSQRIGNQIEQGMTRNVTDKVRGLYYFAGLDIAKNKIVIPKRNTWDPMISFLQNKIPEFFRDKFMEKLHGLR